MNFMQEFCVWWFHTIFDPYARFVYLENFGWATIAVAVVATLLLGLFYKPNRPSCFYDKIMEHYGFPLLIIGMSAIVLPVGSVLLMLVMPGLLILTVGLGGLLLVYLAIRKLRKAYDEHSRLDKERMEEE